jgi:hypothetical protein
LSDDELRQMLRVALANGWRPYSHRVRNGELHLNGDLDAIEAMELAAALERGLKRQGGKLAPQMMVILMESIGVLRYGPSRLVQKH